MQDNNQFLPSPNPAAIQNFITLISRGLALSIEIFLRKPGTIGSRYINLQSIVPIAFIPIFLSFFPAGPHWMPLLYFLGAYGVMLVITRLVTFRRTMHGDSIHSYYTGSPWIMGEDCKISEVTIKNFIEPLLVAGLAFLLFEDYPLLAMYLFIADGCLITSNMTMAMAMRRRVMDMNDAVAEQEIVTEQFRHMRRDNF